MNTARDTHTNIKIAIPLPTLGDSVVVAASRDCIIVWCHDDLIIQNAQTQTIAHHRIAADDDDDITNLPDTEFTTQTHPSM